MRRGRKAFTLVELLVVITIILILIAMLLPSLNKARGQARTVVCLSNMRGIGQWANMYISEWDGWLPTNGTGISDNSNIYTTTGGTLYTDPGGTYLFPKTSWSRKYRAMINYKRGGLYCPQIWSQIIPNPYEKLRGASESAPVDETASTYGINECQGGSNIATLAAPYTDLKVTNLSYRSFWFAETQMPNPNPWYGGGYAFFGDVGLWYSGRFPWPWGNSVPFLEPHNNKSCNFLMGDFSGRTVSWGEYRSWSPKDRQVFAKVPWPIN